jgi:hypothetical protein
MHLRFSCKDNLQVYKMISLAYLSQFSILSIWIEVDNFAQNSFYFLSKLFFSRVEENSVTNELRHSHNEYAKFQDRKLELYQLNYQ